MASRIFIMGTDPKGQGGIASVVSTHLQGLAERFDLRYCVTHAQGSPIRKAVLALRAAMCLTWQLLFHRVQLLHVHSASNDSFLRKSVFLAMARLFGVATIFHLHGGGFRDYVEGLHQPWKRRWVELTLQRSSRVVALSESWARYLHGFAPGSRIEVVPNPIEVPQALAAGAEEPQRVLFLGRVSRQKGTFALVDALSELQKQWPALRLAVAGDGDLQALQQHARARGFLDRLELLGWIDPDERSRQLQRAQVFALPSMHEGLPMAMLEAMAFGRAVVVTPVGGIPEAVHDGVHGLWVEPGSVPSLVTALQRLLADAGLRLRLGAAAREKAASTYGAAQVLERMATIYEELGAPVRASVRLSAGN